MKPSLLSLCVLAALAAPAHAAVSDADVEAQFARLEARIAALEAESSAIRQQAADATTALAQARGEIAELRAAAAPAIAAAPAQAADSGNAFNPAISVILNGSYAHHSLDPDAYERAGFPLAGEAGPGAQGLSLGESELSLSANIDEKFYGQLTLAVESEDGEDGIAVEEAFIDTNALPGGLLLRAGRFFSNIGYLNNHHAHTDKFADRPLAYEAFLGGHYGDDGVQLRWIAPTDLYLEFSGEILRGQNYPSGGAGHDGVGVTTLAVHAGGDVGVENSWLAGISMLRSRTDGGEDGFSGDGELYIADFTWKWAPRGNFQDGGVQLRSEYIVDRRDGDYIDAGDPQLDQPWHGTRRGGYFEGVYRLNRQWETGYRYDRLWADDDGPYASTFDPYRHSVMLAWRNSEFSLFRLQFGRDYPNATDVDDVVLLQYQTALGAHGAHKF